ncbi:MAG: acetyl-CoA carboxylase biotin carboxyl carrier protein subunit [Acidimicrobiaceae bacterium]|jgi:biotin carboxyl carrier protein|nr:acetyl-CoA carboxylase biotin carboxyl carrier protein subunit [Acidimicrobiaceae bacterium]MBD27233.1 acetyl-CoA carboxylase biotin carboxyl carrier protein subunit [Acidimicrobiaceae bacterium]CAI8393156.1 MAG: Biotin/lipoyl attachment protein [Acidimicrobiaceae bacterium]|tara:strand:- start:2810 stop:3025 length:216 start_codon:yes stop_codon:yes gene_type:complete
MQLETPVQGTVWKVVVKVDQTVKAGETLLIIESMKMEIPIESPRSGIVRELLATEGEQVKQDSVVAILEVA